MRLGVENFFLRKFSIATQTRSSSVTLTLRFRRILADPSIFHATQAQAEGGFKSIAELYSEAGLDGLWEGENAEIAGMERILEHWRDLDYREPTLKIICPFDYSRKRFGLFPDGCPNLLWELMRTRREQLSAS